MAKLWNDPDITKNMSASMRRHWQKPGDVANKLEQARRREFGLTSADLYPSQHSRNPRNSEQKD